MSSAASLAKYLTQAVPRYTSYPTVPHFADGFDETTYREWLGALGPDRPISLYLHVPFCRQICWYCGCNMKLAARYEPVAKYVDVLLREVALVADALPARQPVSHLHWGGGTPTALEPADLERVMDLVAARFAIADDAEIAIEGDPRTLTDEMIATVAALGFNRASFGVQEFDPKVQEAINRIQPPDMVEAAVTKLREAGVHAINFDLIYGLPHQTVETLTGTIRRAVAMRPDRVALFGYAHVPWMAKKQRMIDTAALPGAGARLDQAEAAAEELLRAGYRQVGLDHFALPGDALAVAAEGRHLRRNFQGYTTDRAEALIGVGATSIGQLPEGYVQNIAETGAWGRAIEAGRLPVAKGHALTGEDKVRRHVIEQLMCYGEVDIRAVRRRYGLAGTWGREELEQLAPLAAEKLVTLDDDVIRLSGAARPLVRIVASRFDTYFAHREARHSVAV